MPGGGGGSADGRMMICRMVDVGGKRRKETDNEGVGEREKGGRKKSLEGCRLNRKKLRKGSGRYCT